MGKGQRKDKLKQVSEMGGEAKRNDSLRSPQRLAGNEDQLLPGLQNDIVLSHIVPKLPWRTFHVLSSVSSYWRGAIQSGQVHDVRARLDSLETLVVIKFDNRDGYFDSIILYSLREDSWDQLPEFPLSKYRIARSSHCVAVAGSIYVLGGDPIDGRDVGRTLICDGQRFQRSTGREVFVLDLIEQRGWKRCADLPKGMSNFACGVLDGNLYVLGGFDTTTYDCIKECFAYDRKEDSWSSIASMLSARNCHHAVAAKDEVWLHGGLGRQDGILSSEVYYPAKDEWDTVEPQHCHESERLFTARGKPYLMTPDHIYAREDSSKSKRWTQRHSICYDNRPGGKDPGADATLRILGVEAVDRELLVLVVVAVDGLQLFLYRSEGFGTEQEKVYLHMVEEDSLKDQFYCEWFEDTITDAPVMCRIDL